MKDRLAFVVLHVLPHGQRLATQVVTVECDEVERMEEHPTILAALAPGGRTTASRPHHNKAPPVDDAGPRAEASEGFDDEQEARG